MSNGGSSDTQIDIIKRDESDAISPFVTSAL